MIAMAAAATAAANKLANLSITTADNNRALIVCLPACLCMCAGVFTDQLHCSDDDGECCSRISGASPLQLLLLSLSNANVHIAVVWGPAAAVVQSLLCTAAVNSSAQEKECVQQRRAACLAEKRTRMRQRTVRESGDKEEGQNWERTKHTTVERKRESERGNETEETLLFSFCKLSCWAKLRRDNLGDISLHLVVAH